MANVDDFWREQRASRTLIVGFGALTGPSLARIFHDHGVPYGVSDCGPLASIAPRLQALAPLDVFTGEQTASQLAGYTRVLLSPGVPRSVPLVRAALERGLPVVSDLDLFYPLFHDKHILAVSGTDGKTTTTALLSHILANELGVASAGNMGIPLASALADIRAKQAIVLELSSFMLESTQTFRANVSTVLNIAEDHVDRYASMDDYEAAKKRLCDHALPSDVFVRNVDDERIARWDVSRQKSCSFSLRRRDTTAFLADGVLYVDGARLATSALRVRGIHHQSNVLVAASMAAALGMDPARALARAESFPSVPHRFELVGTYGGVDVVDDSKATTVQAVDSALMSLAPRKVVLLFGGRDKLLDVKPLRRHETTLRAVVGYGEAGERMLRDLGHPRSQYVERFEAAAAAAARLTEQGDTLLLSPACTSFDQFRDYAERGEAFRGVARRYLPR